MDINHRKTILDDDASLYNKKHDVVTKEDLKNLTFKQKLAYYKDYYLKITIVVLIVSILAGMLLNETIFNRKNCIMSVGFLNEYQILNTDGMNEALENLLQPESKNDYANVTYYDLDQYNMNMAYVTHTATGGLDIVICSKEEFEFNAGRGLLMDLTELLPAETYEKLSDSILESRIVEEDYETGEVTYGEYQPLGIDITGSKVLSEFGGIGETPVLCVIVTTPNADNVVKTIEYFTGM